MSNAMELALEALTEIAEMGTGICGYTAEKAITEIKEATQQQGEPVAAMEGIYAAWYGAGVDISGGNWKRFTELLPPLFTQAPTIHQAQMTILEQAAERLQKIDTGPNTGGPLFQLGKHYWGSAELLRMRDEIAATAPTIPEGWQLVPTTFSVALYQAFREPWDESRSFGENVKAGYYALLSAAPKQEDWNEKRMDIIGQNGNDGDHYAEA